MHLTYNLLSSDDLQLIICIKIVHAINFIYMLLIPYILDCVLTILIFQVVLLFCIV